MLHPRVAFAVAAAGIGGAGFVLAGRAPSSVLVVAVLAVTAGAAGAAGRPDGTAALGRWIGLAPVWAAVVVVGALRAGSSMVADVRGGNAVGGLALARGEPLVVVACWVATAAGVTAVAVLVPRTLAGLGERLEALSAALLIALLVSVFAGPQVSEPGDALPWLLAATAVTAAATLPPLRTAHPERLTRAAVLASALAVGLAVVGSWT